MSGGERLRALAAPLSVWLGLTLGVALLFRSQYAGSLTFYGGLAAIWGVAGVVAVFTLARRGRLRALLTPKSGDVTMGALVGFLLLAATWLGRSTLARMDNVRQLWLLLVYLQIGSPDAVQKSVLMTTLVFFVVICEELVFRGWIFDELEEQFGPRRAFVLSSLGYAAVIAPTIFTLSAPGVGPNPLLFLAASLLGFVLGFVRRLQGRITTVILAHAVFTYFSVTQFRLPGL